ncbi:translation initiation factor eIF2 assembly protein [Tautogolabrus adspersus]
MSLCHYFRTEQVVNCQFSVWYPIFKNHSIKSVILPLPQNVIDYLLDDGTLVVSGSDHNTQQTDINNADLNAEEDIQWSDDETTTTVTAPEFPEFTSKVLEAINALGGRVFPKLCADVTLSDHIKTYPRIYTTVIG